MTTTIQPLGEYVLLSPIKQEEKTASGLYRPETAKEEKSQQAIVESVGNNDSISKGDRVLFKKFSGEEFEIDGSDFILIKGEDIIAIIK